MKIRNFFLPIFHQLLKISAFALVFFMLPTFLTASDTLPAPFSDLPTNPLWYPAIAVFQGQNIIIGDTVGGIPTGELRPKDYLTRAEFAKVATLVRLLEEKQDEGILNNYMNTDLNDFTLKTNSPLKPYYTSRPGAPKFVDVPEKDITCAKVPGGCEPWFTQYVNYMANLGTIQGTGGGKFSPNDSIKRIHALKMIMVNDGKVTAEQDLRFIRISNDERIKNRVPRCLTGAEDYILANNGGANNFDAKNLLAYALLADKLDVLGNQCQAFGDNGNSLYNKEAVANYLQEPLTRQEIARYFALTTTLSQLQLDPSADPTVDTKDGYIIPVSKEVKEEKDPLEKLKEAGKMSDKSTEVSDSQMQNDRAANEPEEIIHITSPVSPESTIFGCPSFLTDRAGTEDLMRDCVASLRRKNVSEEEIILRLKEAGLWDPVNYKWQSKLVVKTELLVSNAPTPSKLKQDIYKLLDEYNATHSDEETCRYALEYLTTGKIQQDIARRWCKEHGVTEEELVSVKNEPIDRTYYAIGSEYYGGEKAIPFKIIKMGNTDSYKSNDNKTYVLIHGWNSDGSTWSKQMGSTILEREPSAQILVLDWNEIANQFFLKKDKLYDEWIFGFLPNIASMWSNRVLYRLPQFFPVVTKWITPMIDEIKQPLIDWGIDNSNTTVIGHSLGSFAAEKLAGELEWHNGGREINRIIIDPDAFLVKYQLDFEGMEVMTGFHGKGACIIAAGSLAGSKKLMNTCREKYLIEYDDPDNTSISDTAYEFSQQIVNGFLVVKLYKVVKGQKTLIDTAKEMAVGKGVSEVCKLTLETFVLSKACSTTIGIAIDKLKASLITKHNWTHQTYSEIIKHPFYNAYLTPGDIASRVGDSGSPFTNGVVRKGADGVIYTEKGQPSEIKYLKVITKQNPDFYTLYGNNQANIIECAGDRECEMYGGVEYNKETGDIFALDLDSNNYTIKDFRKGKEADKIAIPVANKDSLYPNENVSIGSEPILEIMEWGNNVKVTIDGFTKDQIRGWVRDAKNEDGKLTQKQLEKLPIYIK